MQNFYQMEANNFMHFIYKRIRLSLPSKESPETGLSDLNGAALIREVHVYGQSLAVGAEKTGAAQHVGLGTRLLEEAESIAKQNGF